MKKVIHILSLLFVGIFLVLFPSYSANAQENIPSFTSDLSVQSNGDLHVIETIQYDFSANSKHGIFRTIPLGFKAKGEPGHTEIDTISVTDENKNPYLFDITSQDPLNIKIGDPDEMVTGLHTYVISYTVHAIIGFFDSYDEVYWNVTGDAWEVPIESIKAIVRLPKQTSFSKLQLAQYCGSKDEKKKCGTLASGRDGTVEFSTATNYVSYPGEQVTIGVGFPKGMVTVPSLQDFVITYIKNYWFVPLPFILVFFWFRKRIVRWQKRRAYFKAHTIVADYDPGSFDPLEAAILVNGKAEDKDITAVIVSLAIRGYLKIENTDDEFNFTKIKDVDSEGRAYENLLLKELDGKRESELDTAFGLCASKAIKQAGTSLLARDYVSAKMKKFDSNSKFLPVFLGFFLAINPGVFVLFLLGVGPSFIFSGTSVLIGVVSIFLKPRSAFLSEKGFEAERKLLGLKLYIEVAEKDRINFANAPAKTPELFEKLLPYAMIFGLEKKWAKEFEDIYITPPSWYVGSTGAFSSMVFIHSISSISSVTTQAIAASVPSSSHSSWGGSSGSSGGGSSGGGGGGGGGGSW